MKKVFALLLAAALLVTLAACKQDKPADTTASNNATTQPSVVLPTFPETENPVTYFNISYGETVEKIRNISAFANEDGTVHVEYEGDVKKVGDFDATLFHGIADELKKTALASLNGKDAIEEGAASGSAYVEFDDGTTLAVTYNGKVDPAFVEGYKALDAFFAGATADLPEYIPQPLLVGNVNKDLKTEIDAILSGSQIQALDSLVISQIVQNEEFAYKAGLSQAEGIAEAAVVDPLMSATAYSLVIVTLAADADADAVCEDFAKNIDWVKWVCVSADQALIATKGNMVLCLVAADDLFAQTQPGITAAGWSTVKALTKD